MEVRGSVPPGRAAAHGTAPATAPGPYEEVWRLTVPALDASVPWVRHTVRDLLAGEDVPLDDDLRHGVLVILSELVTNAVLHAAVLSPEITVEVAIGAERITVAVEDNHPYRPKALETDHARTGGRGLLLVGTIAAEAGGSCDVAQTPGGGKVIRAVLPLRPGLP